MNVMCSLVIAVTATVYHAVPSQCNDDYLTTASGREICSTDSAYSHRYVAVSRDLLEEFPYGTLIEVCGCDVEEYNGVWTVADTMNRRYEKAVDFLINPDMRMTKCECEIEKVLSFEKQLVSSRYVQDKQFRLRDYTEGYVTVERDSEHESEGAEYRKAWQTCR